MIDACDTQITDLLRAVPEDHRISIPIQWSECGLETGHHLIPIGGLVHKAADHIDALTQEVERLRGRMKAGKRGVTKIRVQRDDYRQQVLELERIVAGQLIAIDTLSNGLIRERRYCHPQSEHYQQIDAVLKESGNG